MRSLPRSAPSLCSPGMDEAEEPPAGPSTGRASLDASIDEDDDEVRQMWEAAAKRPSVFTAVKRASKAPGDSGAASMASLTGRVSLDASIDDDDDDDEVDRMWEAAAKRPSIFTTVMRPSRTPAKRESAAPTDRRESTDPGLRCGSTMPAVGEAPALTFEPFDSAMDDMSFREDDPDPVKRPSILEPFPLAPSIHPGEDVNELRSNVSLQCTVSRLAPGLYSYGNNSAAEAKLWQAGGDASMEVPTKRFSQAFELPSAKNGCQYGCFLHQAQLFDAHAFNIATSEAFTMSPQQRLLLEAGYHATHDAMLRRQDLHDGREVSHCCRSTAAANPLCPFIQPAPTPFHPVALPHAARTSDCRS